MRTVYWFAKVAVMRSKLANIDIHKPVCGYDGLRRSIDAAGVSLWAWNVDTDDFAMDPHGFKLWDLSPGHDITSSACPKRATPRTGTG